MTALVILILSIFGGTQFFLNPLVWGAAIPAYLVLLGAVVVKRPTPPVVMTVFRWPVAALIVAAVVNGGGWWMVIRLWLVSAALLVMLWPVDPAALRRAMLIAGAAYPLAWLIGPVDNRNIQAVWPLIFAAVALGETSAWKWLYFGAQVGFLVVLGSRGAFIGLGAALAVYFGWRMAALGAVAGIAALFIRPATALVRLDYWREGLAMFLEHPIFGNGPGVIRATGSILHPHAHNFLVSLLATQGLVGLAGAGLAARSAWRVKRCGLRVERWQAAVLVGLAGHSLVDEPLWWPGPLLMAALVIGSIGVGHVKNVTDHDGVGHVFNVTNRSII